MIMRFYRCIDVITIREGKGEKEFSAMKISVIPKAGNRCNVSIWGKVFRKDSGINRTLPIPIELPGN